MGGRKKISFHSKVIIQLSEGGDICYEELQLNYNLIGESKYKRLVIGFSFMFWKKVGREMKAFDI